MKYIVSEASLSASADAIRTKTGSSNTIEWGSESGFANAINEISVGENIKTCAIQLSPILEAQVESVGYSTINSNNEIEYKIITHEKNEILTITDVVCNSVVSIKYTYSGLPVLNGCEQIHLILKTGVGISMLLTVGLTVEPGGMATISGES